MSQDGIRFMGMRYVDPTLAAYVGEDVLLRYDPRDMAEIRVFYPVCVTVWTARGTSASVTDGIPADAPRGKTSPKG